MIDREQIRRECEAIMALDAIQRAPLGIWPERTLALLDELEQAERERDLAVEHRSGLVKDHIRISDDLKAAEREWPASVKHFRRRAVDAEARLAEVTAFVHEIRTTADRIGEEGETVYAGGVWSILNGYADKLEAATAGENE